MKKSLFFYLFMLVSGVVQTCFLYADNIQITNRTSQKWFFAAYYQSCNATRATDIFSVSPKKTITIKRPIFRFNQPRKIIISSTMNDLKKDLKKSEIVNSYSIGNQLLKSYFIIDSPGGPMLASKALLATKKVVETTEDPITLTNTTQYPYYYAIYYVNIDGKRATQIGEIKANETKKVKRPGRKMSHGTGFYDRNLAISTKQAELKQKLTIAQLHEMSWGNIGSKWGSTFYITNVDEEIRVMNDYEKKAYDTLFKKIYNPHKNKSAQVRKGNKLWIEEKLYKKKRLSKANQTLSKLLDMNISAQETPTIAVVCSGGGLRASLFTTGWLAKANEIGLLNAVTYLVGLSGSTWSIGSWLTTGKSIANFKNYMIEQVSKLLPQDINDYIRASKSILAKEIYGQPISPVDFYGAMLANKLLSAEDIGENRDLIGLSYQQLSILNADFPFPIYTAVGADKKTLKQWYEFTPYEVGAPWLGKNGLYIPTYAFGRRFLDGSSKNYAMELPFAHAMGIFGSAFSASASEVFNRILQLKDTPGLKGYISIIMNHLMSSKTKEAISITLGDRRIATGRVYNFTKGINESQVKNLEYLSFVDPGIAFNLPYPPISGIRPERKADIIIFIDASVPFMRINNLKEVEEYAKNNRLPYPLLSDKKNIDKKSITVVEGKSNEPTVIYMPFVGDYNNKEYTKGQYQKLNNFNPTECTNTKFCKTTNFKYTQDEAKQIVQQAELNVEIWREYIKQVIKKHIKRKRKEK